MKYKALISVLLVSYFSLAGCKKGCTNCAVSYKQPEFTPLSEIFSWISEVDESKLTKVRHESSYNGIAPGNLDNVYYTTSSHDMYLAWNFLLSGFEEEEDPRQIAGGVYDKYTFYYGGKKNSITISNGYIFANDKAYKCEHLIGFMDEDVVRYAFHSSSGNYHISKRGNKDYSRDINDLDKIEFIKWPSEALFPESAFRYYIGDYTEASIIDICRSDLFNYRGTMYQIIGDVNFSYLFQ